MYGEPAHDGANPVSSCSGCKSSPARADMVHACRDCCVLHDAMHWFNEESFLSTIQTAISPKTILKFQ